MSGPKAAIFRSPIDTIEIQANETFEAALARETQRSERLRLSIVAILLGLVFSYRGRCLAVRPLVRRGPDDHST